ncbi:MAG: flavin reductase family protein [Pseudomonas sp.]|uniref:flavin reductase family protein n=1 Tax=Pseudomonas sp. TaxID=306 RepID=UPI0027343E20|nr:flavin reductase family protein [Pseudomonas sp.]MDP3847610.1 flavin reductase family protein [Pseudomonas sp.]
MSQDQRLFRNLLGRFATGVCVVAAVGEHRKPIGMTINSFSSASLSPSLVQWSLRKECIAYRLFSDLREFSISVLSENQLEISRQYAKPGDHFLGEADYETSANGVPFIRGSIAHFECRPWQKYEAGDHDIFVSSVDRFVSGEQNEPLVFFEGNYRSLLLI